MTVIAVTNFKGGVGKTTTSIYLAALAARRGLAALVADANPDGAAAVWVEAATAAGWLEGVQAVEVPSERLLARLLEMPSGPGEVIVIDTPPNSIPIATVAMEHADAIIIPTRTGGSEADRVAATLKMIPEGKRRGIVICAGKTGTRILSETVDAWRNADEEVWAVVPDRIGIGASETAPLNQAGLVAYEGLLEAALEAIGDRQ